MILDSIALSLVAYEINKQIIPARILDLYQIEQYGILLVLKNKKGDHKIFFSLKPDRMTFFISEIIPLKENVSSTFTKQLKSQLQGGKLSKIEQLDFDRIIKLTIQSYHKFGPSVEYNLIFEFMGKHSNAILIDENGFIKTALKQVGSELNRYREIKPGILYKSPPAQDKLNPLTVNKEQFLNIFLRNSASSQPDYWWQLLCHNFQGISQKSAREMVSFLKFPADQKVSELQSEQLINLWEAFCNFREKIIQHNITPLLLIDRNSGKAIDYSLISPIESSEIEYLSFNQVSACLESFYYQISKEKKKQELHQIIIKILNKNREKLEEKNKILKRKNKEIEDCEQYKKKGELIKANLWNIKYGMHQVTLIDYTEPGLPRIDIELNPNFSPLQNARQFFQRYKKLTVNRVRIKKQLLENQESLKQLNEIYLKLSESKNSLSKLTALYQKLVQLNYIKRGKGIGSKNSIKRMPSILKFLSTDGWNILVGKNSQQNEYILRHLSSGNDFWLHHQLKSGAHVIIKNHQNLSSPPPDTLTFAARLTGYYSRVKNYETAPIIYTLRKYVKKPKNSKVGKVVYSQEKSIPVFIDYEEIQKDINKMILT